MKESELVVLKGAYVGNELGASSKDFLENETKKKSDKAKSY